MISQIIEYKKMPEKLKNINNPPKKLFALGNINLLYEDSFAIIGTRRITEYGIRNCKLFSKELSLRNIPIVSGMAIGTDTIAHKTALENQGKTIAVLGSGFNNIFPKENIELFNKIIENDGLVITEYEEDVKPYKEHFPLRNRIITAISEGVLVIEAAYRSGTSITVKKAKEQGKYVFALPGKLDSCVGVGVNIMIKKGAILTTNVGDILERYPQFMSRMRKKEPRKLVSMKKEYIEIFREIEKGRTNIEELSKSTSMGIIDVLKTISNMEMDGIIKKNFIGEIEITEEYKSKEK